MTANKLNFTYMKTIITALLLSILICVSSCKQRDADAEATTDPPPVSTFDSPFPKNNKRLSNILGDSLMLKSFGDTLMLKITSTKNDNLIINSKTGDTLFFGSVCKYRDLYYFNEKLNDSSYYISAVKIKGDLIYGLNNSWLQFLEVDDEIIKGNNKKLIKYINHDTTVIRLHPDKKELRNLFTSIMNDVEPDTILSYAKTDFNAFEKTESVTELEQDTNGNVLKVYPNPATDFITIELKQKNKSSFQLTDGNGRTVLQGQLNEMVNKIDIGNQPSGIYFLTVNTENNLEKNKSETIKIVIK